jgi:hypothetical protein
MHGKIIITTFDECLSMKQLSDLIKYLHGADYLTLECNIMLESEDVKVSSGRNNSEIICHYWLEGENPKGIGTDSSDEDDGEEEEIEEEIEENTPEYLEEYCPIVDNFVLDPDKWTRWMHYDEDELIILY